MLLARDIHSLNFLSTTLHLHFNQILEVQNKEFWRTNSFIRSFTSPKTIHKLIINSHLTLSKQITLQLQISNNKLNISSSQPDCNNKEKLKQLCVESKTSATISKSLRPMGSINIWWKEAPLIIQKLWWVTLMEPSYLQVLCRIKEIQFKMCSC